MKHECATYPCDKCYYVANLRSRLAARIGIQYQGITFDSHDVSKSFYMEQKKEPVQMLAYCKTAYRNSKRLIVILYLGFFGLF